MCAFKGHRCQVTAGSPAGHDDPTRRYTNLRTLRMQPADGRAYLFDNLSERRFRGQRVANKRDVDAAREGPKSKASVEFFCIALPVAAVNVDQQRRFLVAAPENIDAKI